MRIRTVKPEWLDDERLVLASADARVLSIALIIMADDEGRGRANATMLAARVFPGSGDPRASAVTALSDLAAVRFVVVYEVDGQTYYQVRNWRKHQRIDRPKASQLPPPPSEIERNVAESNDSTIDRRTIDDASTNDRGSIDVGLDQDREWTTTTTAARTGACVASLEPARIKPRHELALEPAAPLATRCLVAFDEGYASAIPSGQKLGIKNKHFDVADQLAVAVEMRPEDPESLFREAGAEVARRTLASMKTKFKIRNPWLVFSTSALGTWLGGEANEAGTATLDALQAQEREAARRFRELEDAHDRAPYDDRPRLADGVEAARVSLAGIQRRLRTAEAQQ